MQRCPVMQNRRPSRSDRRHRSQTEDLLSLASKRQVASGQVTDSTLVDGKSHTIKRVVHSTFAGEVMAACEGMGAAIYLRGLLLECLQGRQATTQVDVKSREMLPLIGVTDCKSVFDCVHRDGVLKLPSEKRLGLEVASLREMVTEEAGDIDPTKLHALPFRWVPTEFQLADCLTKGMDGSALRHVITTGQFSLREGESGVRLVKGKRDDNDPAGFKDHAVLLTDHEVACIKCWGLQDYVLAVCDG